MKFLKIFFPFLFIVGIFLFFFIEGKINDDRFFEQKINSKIVKSNDWQVRAIEYYLENGLRIDSSALNNFDLKIRDSICKKSKTWKFVVYRKNALGKYVFHKYYDYSK